MTLSITTFRMTTLSITTFRITTLSIMTLSKKGACDIQQRFHSA
jgi:hypothetical protein